MSFFKSVLGFVSGNTIGGTLARVALLGYASRLLNKNVLPDTKIAERIDPGVRLQLDASLDNKIPVLYGEAYFGGYLTDAVLSSDYKTMTYCLTLAETTGSRLSGGSTSYAFEDVYLDNKRVIFKADGITVDYTVDSEGNQDLSARDLIKIYFYAGEAKLQPVGYSGSTPAAHLVMPGWTAQTHPMTNLIYAIVEVTYSRANNIVGLPNFLFNISNTLTRPGDVIYDFLTNTRYGAGIAPSDINISSLIGLNAFAQTGFSYTDVDNNVQTQPIDINGLIDTNIEVLPILEEMATASSAWLSYNIHRGQWEVIIDKAETSIASMSDSNIVGEITVSGTSLTQISNAADIQFQNTDIQDKPDFVKVSLPSEELFENELPNTLQLSLPFTNKQTVATKLGLQILKQGRVDKIIRFQTDYSFVNLNAGDVIDVTSDVYGFTNKLFRIIEVEEAEGELGEILINFTCLEYDDDVYAFNIVEFLVETRDGIISIGSIGQPNQPTVTTINVSNTPRVVVTARVPSGIVDRLEFWLTNDTLLVNDVDRVYTLIGGFSNPEGGVLVENQEIQFVYTPSSQSDFFIKVRGVNNLRSGPYSQPTGLVQYVPQIAADTLSDIPVNYEGQIMGLGLLTLLNNLDELLKVFNGEKGVFDTIKDIFFPNDTTGSTNMSDLLLNDQQFISGAPIPARLADLSDVDPATAKTGEYLVYDGNRWVPTDVLPGTVTAIDNLSDVDTTTKPPSFNDMLVWNGSKWIPSPSCCDIVVEPCFFSLTPTLPAPDTMMGELTNFLRITTPSSTFKRTGNFYLYKSDGTLVETVSIDACQFAQTTITIPLSGTLDECTWYYVLADGAIVQDCDGCISSRICSPTAWQFKTTRALPDPAPVPFDPGFPEPPGPPAPAPAPEPTGPSAIEPVSGECEATFTGQACGVTITYNQTIKKGDGDIEIQDEQGNVLFSINSCQTELSGRTITLPCFFVDPGQTYYLRPTPSFVVSIQQPIDCVSSVPALDFSPREIESEPLRGPDTGGAATPTAGSPELALDFFGTPTAGTGKLRVIDRDTGEVLQTVDASEVTIDTSPSTDTVQVINTVDATTGNSEPFNLQQQVDPNTTIKIKFNKTIVPKTGNFYLYKGSTVIQTFDVRSNFFTDDTSGIITLSSDTVTLKPTVCLDVESEYHIRADANVVVSLCQQPFLGISDDSVLKFKTINKVAPVITINTPLPNSNQSVAETGIVIETPGNPVPGTGQVKIFDENDNLIDTISASDSRVSFA